MLASSVCSAELTTGPQQSMDGWAQLLSLLSPSASIARSSTPTLFAIERIRSRSKVAPKDGPLGKFVCIRRARVN